MLALLTRSRFYGDGKGKVLSEEERAAENKMERERLEKLKQKAREREKFEESSVAYAKGEVHPGDIKPSLAKASNRILESQVKDLVQVLGDDKLSPFFRCDLRAVTLSKSKWT